MAASVGDFRGMVYNLKTSGSAAVNTFFPALFVQKTQCGICKILNAFQFTGHIEHAMVFFIRFGHSGLDQLFLNNELLPLEMH